MLSWLKIITLKYFFSEFWILSKVLESIFVFLKKFSWMRIWFKTTPKTTFNPYTNIHCGHLSRVLSLIIIIITTIYTRFTAKRTKKALIYVKISLNDTPNWATSQAVYERGYTYTQIYKYCCCLYKFIYVA